MGSLAGGQSTRGGGRFVRGWVAGHGAQEQRGEAAQTRSQRRTVAVGNSCLSYCKFRPDSPDPAARRGLMYRVSRERVRNRSYNGFASAAVPAESGPWNRTDTEDTACRYRSMN